MIKSLLREFIKEIISGDGNRPAKNNPAYAKHAEFDRKWGKLSPPGTSSAHLEYEPDLKGERKMLFRQTIDVLTNYVNLTPDKIKKIAIKIESMDDNTLYFLKSYLSQRHRGWSDLKHLLLPGFG